VSAPKHAFLGGRSIPPGLNEDNPTVMAMATAVADELDGTYGIPGG
jgi:hypothetical protein